ncbi:MAG: beta-galactosidase GalA [Janthinobacterium lividum]
MNLPRLFSCLTIACALVSFPIYSARADAQSPRQRQLMDAGWRFQLADPDTPAHAAAVTAWRWRPGTAGDAAQMTAAGLDTTGADWKDATVGMDTFGGRAGSSWYRTTLPALAYPNRVLHFESVDDNATVYLNGIKLSHHEGWNDPFNVPLDKAWKVDGPNSLTVLVENTAGNGGIMGAVTLGTIVPGSNPISPAYNDKSWRIVHLPHDYVVEGKFDPNGDSNHAALPTPRAWYRKTFTLPASDIGRSVWIDFDGVYRDAVVYLNGQKLGEHPGGYDGFRYDISQAAHYGSANVLAVSVNPAHHEGWWYEGGGIYRHVWLNVAASVHIAPWGTFVTAKLPEPGADGKVAPATVTIQTKLMSPIFVTVGAPQLGFRLVSRVLDPAGKLVSSTVTPIGMLGEPKAITQKVAVAHPLLWSLETPRLYHLHTEVMNGSSIVDATDTPFGIRTIRFDAEKGFFLNGKSVKIKGTCNHQDFAGVGIGMPDSLLYWRIKKLKAMGSNAYRMSHNPPTAELLDACDKLGMLVMDESRHLGDTEEAKSSLDTPYSDLGELKSMILRDRNHPSVIMWSMCNEEGIQYSAQAATIFAAMKRVVETDDGTRPVTCAMNGGYDSAVGITSVEDLQGINYHTGDYDAFHKTHPNMPLYGSETSSEVGTRGVYSEDKFSSGGNYTGIPDLGYVSAYDTNGVPWGQTAEAAWQPIADRPFVAGGYVWTGFDYKGEPTPFGWPDINSNFGVMDECGFPKDTYYYYQSVWGDKPIVHILPHWNWAGKEGQPIDVWAFSNADRVELLLNGKSLGTKEMPKNGHASWSVPYAPGTLEARGFDNGQVIAADKVETTGAPAALRLVTDRTALTADGEDVSMVEVDIVDAQGRVVPTADNPVSFSVTGAGHIAGVGNGDPSSHEPDQAGSRHAFNGKCMVIVGANQVPGPIHLTAASRGLQSVSRTMHAK